MINSSQGKITFNSADTEFLWLNSNEAASFLSISEAALRNLTSNGKIPYYKLGRRNRYLASELNQMMLKNRRGVRYGN